MKSAAALKLKLAQWATENSPPSHPIALLLFIIQEVERDSADQGSLSPLPSSIILGAVPRIQKPILRKTRLRTHTHSLSL